MKTLLKSISIRIYVFLILFLIVTNDLKLSASIAAKKFVSNHHARQHIVHYKNNLFHLCTPVLIKQKFSIDCSEVEKLLCVILYTSCETLQTCPPFKLLNRSVLQKTGYALPSLKKSIIILSLFTLHNIIISPDR